MMALASVDLPEPLGPISAWNSPARTCRSTPLRICFSPALTWRFLIWSSPMCPWSQSLGSRYGLRDGDAARRGTLVELDELRERGALQRADHAHLHPRPQQLGRARAGALTVVRALDAAVAVVEEAVHRGDRALEREHRLIHRDLLRRAREYVTAVRAARGGHQPGLLEQRGDALAVGQRQVLRLGNRLQGDRMPVAATPQLDQQPHAVLGL